MIAVIRNTFESEKEILCDIESQLIKLDTLFISIARIICLARILQSSEYPPADIFLSELNDLKIGKYLKGLGTEAGYDKLTSILLK